MARSESESEVFCIQGGKSIFYRSSSGRLYCGSEERDGCATNEETILILGEENQGEVSFDDLKVNAKIWV